MLIFKYPEKEILFGVLHMATEILKQSEVQNSFYTPSDEEHEATMFKMVNDHANEMKKVREKRESETLYKTLTDKIALFEKKEEKHKNRVFNLITFICVLFFLWVLISWVNVATCNNQPNAMDMIWSWNFFKVFFK